MDPRRPCTQQVIDVARSAASSDGSDLRARPIDRSRTFSPQRTCWLIVHYAVQITVGILIKYLR
jgi:hypothetical protein